MSVVIPVPTALTVQDLTEIAQAVKQVTGVEKLAWSGATNEIVMRDRVSRVIPAKAIVEQLVAYRGSVMIELRFLQLSDSDILSYGVNLTNTFNIFYQDVSNPTLANILSIFLNGKNFAIGGINASIVASLTKSGTRTVLDTHVRGVSGKPSTFHVGEKYPILTSAYIGGTAASTVGAYTPPPSFTYQDLGVSLKITPVVGNELVTLDVESEYQLLGASSIDGIPILTNRKYASRVSLRNDEWAIIGGLTDETQDKSVSGVAGLARIPLLGWLFKTKNTEKDRDHIVILMKPYVVGEAPGGEASPAMGVGTDTRPLSPI
jgi:general secretion pathway protein D